MAVVIRWECDHCGRDVDVTAEEPSRVVSLYIPARWGMAKSGWLTSYSTYCSAECFDAIRATKWVDQ